MRAKLYVGSILLAGFLTVLGPAAWSQQLPMHRGRAQDDAPPAPDASMTRKMLKASYEQLQKDVDRLADLAAQLKEEVTTTDDEDVLSLSGVKKAEEIEKLSKKIQSRMKNL